MFEKVLNKIVLEITGKQSYQENTRNTVRNMFDEIKKYNRPDL